MNKELLKEAVTSLAKRSGGENWCPAGGWQYPFDFGQGVIAPTYTPTQQELHPWRKDILLSNLDSIYKDKYETISVLDLGSGEGAMALALWQRGVRDITCVELREINVEKAKFVFNHFKADITIIRESLEVFLDTNDKKYDLVLFMGILYHILDPFSTMHKIENCCKDTLVLETVIAKPSEKVKFLNESHYSSTSAGFFIRVDTNESATAGISNLELWPTLDALDFLLKTNNFQKFTSFNLNGTIPKVYTTGERVIGYTQKDKVQSSHFREGKASIN